VAAYAGTGSPLTHAVGPGVGLNLSDGEWQAGLDRMERFFRERGATPAVEVSTLADFRLLELLGSRGYRPAEWNHVLWRRLERGEWLGAAPRDVAVQLARDAEGWSRNLARGFFARDEVSAEEEQIGIPLFHARGAQAYEAVLGDSGGVVAGCGALTVGDGVALFHADSTIEGYRARGVQAALIRRRLGDALDGGATLATAATMPGTVSQRNYERYGFQVLYARLNLVL
jgi:hypothetical protein